MRLGILFGLALVVATAHAADVAGDLDAVRKAAPTCDRTRAHCFGIQLHIAADAHGLAASPEWIATQVATANRHFARLDVGFEVVGVDQLPESALHVANRRERDELAAGRLGGPVIHVFVVGQLDDVDEEDAIAYGVTWHTRTDDRKYVIVSNAALERTLAHELGHFFGLPHSTYAISIMNKSERDDPPMDQRTFADEEIEAMKPVLHRLLRDHVIADVR
ncbi:MAG TPA: matrixin family metalloprotease [Kofleriaceae bacterium]|nr:matrixin family metalloprotease [Kofleriaceae bacterium]